MSLARWLPALAPSAALVLVSAPLAARLPTFRDGLLDRFVGRWVLRGTIGGRPTIHHLTDEWVLGHH